MNTAEYLQEIDRVIKKGPYSDSWESLTSMELPEWFKKDKFGIFIHWGVFSVPAFGNEWYSRCMYDKNDRAYQHHIETYGPHKDFGYKDFIPMFKAEKFNAAEWVETFKNAGARYMVPVAEHHDGFQMYQSQFSHWNAAEMGPHHDVIGELKKEADKAGITFACSTHRAEHYWFMGIGREFESDITGEFQRGDFYWPSVAEQPDMGSCTCDPQTSEEFLEDWLLRTCEIIDRFHPAILYFDWWIMHKSYKATMRKIMAYYYNRGVEWGQKVAVCYKHDAIPFGSGIVDVERGKFADTKPYYWQTDTAIAHNSWCYIDDLRYKNSRELVCYLCDVVAKNGNLLLNVGPKADGTIPDTDKQILSEIGSWLKVNGEAIYDSKPWRACQEGPTAEKEGKFSDEKDKKYTSEDYRFTCGNGAVYAINMSYPEDGHLAIKSLGMGGVDTMAFQGMITGVEILGQGAVKFEQTDEALHVYGPKLDTSFPVVVKVITD